jgi:hypothetical protein
MRPLATPSLELKGGFWAAREVSGRTGSGLVRLTSSDQSEKNRTEGGNDANTPWDQRCRARVDCRLLGANCDAVAAAVDRWTTVLAENNPDTIVALYSKDAVLWGTLSPTVRSDPAGLKAYFVGAYQALPKLTVKFGEQFIRVYGDTAVNTGYYTLFYTKDGEAKSIPARYSFTYVKDGNDCKIVDHHSSAVPPR